MKKYLVSFSATFENGAIGHGRSFVTADKPVSQEIIETWESLAVQHMPGVASISILSFQPLAV